MTPPVSALPASRRLSLIVGIVVAVAVAAASPASASATPQLHASSAPTRRCLIEYGVSVRLVPAKAAIGPEGDLLFRFPSGRRGRLSFFRTYAAAQTRTAIDARNSNLRIAYRLLNVEVAWETKPGLPTAAEKAAMSGCIRQRGVPPTG
ncbi:MAG TPA: hypothetical protein VMG74_11260 [Gaiellaceae bacterium]|nr:hypothetical protein [Gaiellaceae bacterium]